MSDELVFDIVMIVICLIAAVVSLIIGFVYYYKKEKPIKDKEKQEKFAKKELEDQIKSELEIGKQKLSLFKASRDKLPSVIDSIIDVKRNSEELKYKSVLTRNGSELYELNRKFESLVASIKSNVQSRSIVFRSKPKSAALYGGIANGLAGTGAGIYTALKIDQDNRSAKEKEDNALAERKRIAKEADKYYNEIESVFLKIKQINSLHMQDKVPFLKNIFANSRYNYKESYHTCYKYIDSSDENIRLCARAFAWYYYTLVDIEEYRELEKYYVGTYI